MKRRRPLTKAERLLVSLGKDCAVSISGMSEDACDVNTPTEALHAIQAALLLGKENTHELNQLRRILTGGAIDRKADSK